MVQSSSMEWSLAEENGLGPPPGFEPDLELERPVEPTIGELRPTTSSSLSMLIGLALIDLGVSARVGEGTFILYFFFNDGSSLSKETNLFFRANLENSKVGLILQN